MFNIGFAELLLVLVIAYVIVGPKDLPKVARWLARMVKRMRQLIKEVKDEIGWNELMDEVGHLEKRALLFQSAIRDCLDGDIPVLGVLRKDQEWHAFIKNHPKVRVITVTEENRGGMADRVAAILRGEAP